MTDDATPTSSPYRPACAHCGELFRARRHGAAFCSTRCRVAAHRAEKRATRPAKPDTVTEADFAALDVAPAHMPDRHMPDAPTTSEATGRLPKARPP